MVLVSIGFQTSDLGIAWMLASKNTKNTCTQATGRCGRFSGPNQRPSWRGAFSGSARRWLWFDWCELKTWEWSRIPHPFHNMPNAFGSITWILSGFPDPLFHLFTIFFHPFRVKIFGPSRDVFFVFIACCPALGWWSSLLPLWPPSAPPVAVAATAATRGLLSKTKFSLWAFQKSTRKGIE